MKYFIIILIIILISIFLINIKLRIYKRNNEKYNIDLSFFFIIKITIDIDELYQKYMKDKKQLEIIKDLKNTINFINKNKYQIKQILKKITIDKIIIITQIVPSNPIIYSYVQFINYQLLNTIKKISHNYFKKVRKEDYQVTLLENNINKKWNEPLTFDITLSTSLFTLLIIIIKHFNILMKGKKYGTTSN